MIQISFPYIEFYVCFCRVYNAQTDDWYKKGLHIRLGSHAYAFGNGWRNWRKEA